MRQGRNPFGSTETVEPPARITVGVLSCIPEESGYFAGALASLELCLASARAHAGRGKELPVDLLVVDNASCPAVRERLLAWHADGRIDHLLLNRRNLGRPNGVRQVLRAAAGDLVVYSDGDIYFRQGWLRAHLEVLEAFPAVGMVGGVPIRKLVERHTGATRRWLEGAEAEVEIAAGRLSVERGDLVPDETSLEYLRSVGAADPSATLDDWRRDFVDVRLERDGVAAYVGASHMQFLMPRAMIERLPHERFDRPMKLNERITDDPIDAEGRLRLSTAEPVVYHAGNALTEPWLRAEHARLVGGAGTSSTRSDRPSTGRLSRAADALLRRHRARQLLRRVHDWTFEVLTERRP